MAGFYTEDSIQRIRDTVDIVNVIESYFPLKKTGTRYKALCPFHNEKTPSFTVNPDLQLFKCFGCGAGGDTIKFVMQMEGLEFPEAIEVLSDRTGIQLEKKEGISVDPGASNDKKSLYRINHLALKYFEESLQKNSAALSYLKDRGFTDHTITTWRLGWSPDSYEGFLDYIENQCGEKKDAALKYAAMAGLIKEGNNGYYDFFRGRVMFPIMDIQHRPIAFGGRILVENPERKVGKYLNSPETPLFSKSKVLFGLDSAAKEIRISGNATIVEGYTDVIMCHQYGLRNVVATLGTALTNEHVRLLRRYADKVTARFDSDNAGLNATEKAIRIFVEEDMPLDIIRSEEVKDACEYLPQYGKEGFLEEEKSAEDSFSYFLRRCFGSEGELSIDQKAVAVKKAIELINLSPNKVKSEMLRKKIANLAGISEESLPAKNRSQFNSRKRQIPNDREEFGYKKHFSSSAESEPASFEPTMKTVNSSSLNKDKRLLEYMLENRIWCEEICRIKPPEKFSTEVLRSLAADIYDHYNKNTDCYGIDLSVFIKHVSDPLSSQILSDIAMQESPELNEGKLAETLHFIELQELTDERARLQHDYRLSQGSGSSQEIESMIKEINLLSRQIDILKQKEIPSKIKGSAA
ncbi:MAG: DNA primase [Planctomycetota bacterium]